MATKRLIHQQGQEHTARNPESHSSVSRRRILGRRAGALLAAGTIAWGGVTQGATIVDRVQAQFGEAPAVIAEDGEPDRVETLPDGTVIEQELHREVVLGRGNSPMDVAHELADAYGGDARAYSAQIMDAIAEDNAENGLGSASNSQTTWYAGQVVDIVESPQTNEAGIGQLIRETEIARPDGSVETLTETLDNHGNVISKTQASSIAFGPDANS